jgi:hypothetical protein
MKLVKDILKQHLQEETMKIILNGQATEVDRDTLSFEDLRRLAGKPFADTITYHRAVAPKDGTLTPESWVTVKEGSVVNVTNTGNA